MPTATTNYAFSKPIPGGDDDVWGDELNSALDDIDTEIKAREDEIDAAILGAQIPVGGIYLSVDATNPATTLGYGTWVAYATGRALVGVGNNGTTNWTAALEAGSDTHLLTNAELPAHTHTIPALSGSGTTDVQGNHNHRIGGLNQLTGGGGGFDANGNTASTFTDTAGSHSHSVSITTVASNTGSHGSTQAHSSIQHSIAIHVWHRTA